MASSSSPSSPPPNWLNLPTELTANILHRLGAIEILESAQMVCMTWHKICKEPSMWSSIDMRKHDNLYNTKYNVQNLCQTAVDRSCGGLNSIVIHYFATERLLHYIADRAPKLRSLQVAFGYTTTEKGLGEIAEKLTNLEELHMFFTRMSVDDFESFGRSCPRLKSITYHIEGSRCLFIKDEGEWVTRRIYKCPDLESFGITQCYNVELDGDMETISAFRVDSTDGYNFDVNSFCWCVMTASEMCCCANKKRRDCLD